MVSKTLKIASGSVRTNFPSHSYAHTHVEAIVIVIKIHYTWVTVGNLALEDGCLVKPFNEINQRWLDSVHKCCNLCIFQPLQTGGFVVNLLFICLFYFVLLFQTVRAGSSTQTTAPSAVPKRLGGSWQNDQRQWGESVTSLSGLELVKVFIMQQKNCALTGFISTKKLKALVITIP